jgi:hypothetical protein
MLALAVVFVAGATLGVRESLRNDDRRAPRAASVSAISQGHATLASLTPAAPTRSRVFSPWIPALSLALALAAAMLAAGARRTRISVRAQYGNVNRRGPPHHATLI